MRWLVVVGCLTGGCQVVFPLDREGPLRVDATHVSDEDSILPGEDLVELENVAIDTDAMTIEPPLAELDAVSQDTGGPELAVIRGGAIVFRGTIKITGSRPLVVLGTKIEVAATLDASADRAVAGPGAAAAGDGGDGLHTGEGNPAIGSDSGGGGGGFATTGGAGGPTCLDGDNTVDPGGMAGIVFGDRALMILQGGGRGGDGSQAISASQQEIDCSELTPGGGGGGAIQLSARDSILISGVIDASGGGGAGGLACQSFSAGGGGGGGSGGAIFIEARFVDITGTLAANGGGGGAGGHAPFSMPNVHNPGMAGADGIPGVAAAPGGPPNNSSTNQGGAAGGAGGVLGEAPGDGLLICNGQSGGGGGSVGRIVVRGDQLTIGGVTSPEPVPLAFEP